MEVYQGEAGYLSLLRDILENGSDSDDRTGVGTRKVFGRMIRFDLKEGFPLLTTKKVWFHGIRTELLWFISGSTNIRPLILEDVHIWDEWPFQVWLEKSGNASRVPKGSEIWYVQMANFIRRVASEEEFAIVHGGLGSQAYGEGWRNFNGFDQLENAIEMIRQDPKSRRILVNAWNPVEVANMPKGSLPPCHYGYQFVVDKDKLSILVNIRSWDVFLGGPFNIASYSLLLHMVSQITGYEANEMIIVSADTHIYKNHFDAVTTQLSRTPYKLPRLWLNPDIVEINEYKKEDIKVLDYSFHPAIKAEIAV